VLLKDIRLTASGRAVIPIQKFTTKLNSEGRTSAFYGYYDIGLLYTCFVKKLPASISFVNIGCSVCSCVLRRRQCTAVTMHTDSGKFY
jgi:hypothetical protein